MFGANLNDAETISSNPELVDMITQADIDDDGNISTSELFNIMRYLPSNVVYSQQDCNDCLSGALEQGSDPNLCISRCQ